MYDLHTHILPYIDDGAGSLEESLTMLEMEARQGVEAVALTPHFYRSREHIEKFLERREASMEQLTKALEDKVYPKLILGAEVAWVPGIVDWDRLEELCYQGTKILLVELPFTPWNDEMFRQLYNLEMRRGITPMIAHLERYFLCQEKRHFNTLAEMDFPVQISAAEPSGLFLRRRATNYLKNKNAILISDCHNCTTRPPNINSAIERIKKKYGVEISNRISMETEEILAE